MFKVFTMSVFVKPLMDWFIFGMVIETGPKFYMVPSQSQFTDFEFFCVKSLQCQLLQSLWLIWIVFGMNGYKILKCFRKEKRVSGKLPCPATGLIHLWCDDRALSIILRRTIPIPVHGLKVKVTDFEFFVFNFYSVSFCKAFDWFESCLVWIDIRF